MARQLTTSVASMVEAAEAEIRTLTPREARAMQESGEALLIDIRDIRELARTGLVPGARHCPRDMLEFWVDPESPYHKPDFATDKTFIFFCAGGKRSALATKTVQDMGLAPVANIGGGFSAWKEEGLPVDTAAADA